MFQKKSLYYALPAIILSTLLVAVVILAWTEPGVAPPGGNVDAPINVGGTGQWKTGSLRLGGLTVDSATNLATQSGNVGIGTTTPAAKLDISLGGTSATAIRALSGGATNWTGIGIGRTATDGFFVVAGGAGQWSNFATGGDIILRTDTEDLILTARNALGAIRFGTGAADTEKVTILSGGNVGIGTTAPTNILSLGSGTDRTFWIERSPSATAGRRLTVQAGGAVSAGTNLAGGELRLASGIATGTGTSFISFYTATAGASGTADRTPSEKMRIDGAGNVGIGDTTPAALFTVGSGDLFQINSSGNLIRINNVPYSWPTAQGGANTFLRNDGAGGLSWVTVAGGGDITGVIAGTGLSGGGLSGDVTLSADTAFLQRRVTGTCPAGSSIRVVAADGTVTCETDDTGAGGGAPVGASYVVMASDGTLTSERILTAGSGISMSDGGAGGNVTLSASIGTVNITDGAVTSAKISWPLLSTMDGTVSAPAYSWLADTNMGIRRGGADNLRFVTNNLDRVTIESDGDVGIGTTAPGARLEVAGQVKITGGSPGAGKVLTSDATGLASWATPAAGGGAYEVPLIWMHEDSPDTRNAWTTLGTSTITASRSGTLIIFLTAGTSIGGTDDVWRWRLMVNNTERGMMRQEDVYSTLIRAVGVSAGMNFTIECQYFIEGGSHTDIGDCAFFGILF